MYLNWKHCASPFVSDVGARNFIPNGYKGGMENNIRKYRIIAGLSQEKLGRLVGIQRAAMSKLERGGMNVTTSYLERISKVLNCTPEELIASPKSQNGTNDALIYAIKEILKLMLKEDGKPVTRDKIRMDFIKGIALFDSEGLQGGVAVLDDLLGYVEGKQLPEEIHISPPTLKLVPPV